MRAFIAAITLTGLMGGAGQAQAQALENCANARLPAGDTIRFCQKALQDRGMKPKVRAQVLVTLGVALADQGRHTDALVNYALAQRADPGLMPAYTNRARSNEALGRVEDALADYEAAIAVDDGWFDAWAGRGALLLGQNRPDLALPDLDRAVAIDDGDVSVRFNRGIARLGAGDAAAAEGDFTAILARMPGDAGAHLNRGRARAVLGSQEAEADFDRALTLSPEWGWGHFARARFHDDAGRTEAANADYLRAFELGFSTPWLIEKVREISGS